MTSTASSPTESEAVRLPGRLVDHTSFLLAKLGLESRKRMGDSLATAGVRLQHYAVLSCLDEAGLISQKDVAARIHLDPADLVAVLDDLERDGHVVRGRDARDRRRYALALTPTGRKFLRRLDGMVERANDGLLETLDDRDRAQLHALLRRVAASIDPRVR
jgi:DNA-binding MarR family transcriptional regulator